MDMKHRFSLRKTTMGLVSAMILGITVMPIANTAFAESGSQDAEIIALHQSQPPDDLAWTANTVSQISTEINEQLESQEESKQYVIQWGDTVWGITQAFDLDMTSFILANKIDNPDLIYTNDIVTLDVERLAQAAGTSQQTSPGQANNETSAPAQQTAEAPAQTQQSTEAPASEQQSSETPTATEEVAETPSNAVTQKAPEEDVGYVDEPSEEDLISEVDDTLPEAEVTPDLESEDEVDREPVVEDVEEAPPVEDELIDEEVIETPVDEEPITETPEVPALPVDPVPETPVQPDVPEETVPEVPVEPETPESPEVPVDPVPETPEEPVIPEVPVDPVPETPEEPVVPEQPIEPEVPEVPVTPEVPEDPEPETPESPEVPVDPVPETPEEPVVPEVPVDPVPETPEEPIEPEVPVPDVPVSPELPVDPEPDVPTEPEEERTTRVVERTYSVAFETIYEERADMYPGESIVVQEGVNGIRTERIRQTLINGEVYDEVSISNEMTTQPINKIVHKGADISYMDRVIAEYDVPFEIEYLETTNLPVGQQRILRTGVNGRVERTYEVLMTNGEEDGERTLVNERVLVRAVPQLVEVGVEPTYYDDVNDMIANFDAMTFNHELIHIINEERMSQGLDAYEYDGILQKGADIRTQEIFSEKSLRVDGKSHTRPDGSSWVTALDYIGDQERTIAFGENMSLTVFMVDQIEAEVLTGQKTFEQLMAEKAYGWYEGSPAHYALMMDPDFTGVATASLVEQHSEFAWAYNIYNTLLFVQRY